MADAQILLLSSSRAGDSDYLAPCIKPITEHCGQRRILFIPYAGVGFSHAAYTEKVRAALAPTGIEIYGIESETDPVTAIKHAEAIMVGGGNTFQLLAKLYENKLIAPIRAAVKSGIPYIGWSAGSNIAGLSIRTTNDMPIIEPPSFQALNLVPVQLNPHYTDYQPPGFHGETRDQRLGEFMAIEPNTPIIAIPEGAYLRINGAQMHYFGDAPGYVFKGGIKQPIMPEQACSQWL
ncbi:MAG: dipeptidase PepE [Idiomarina sp.]|nr:MAG: dipeptidase PepE [Idiomarina sp.]